MNSIESGKAYLNLLEQLRAHNEVYQALHTGGLTEMRIMQGDDATILLAAASFQNIETMHNVIRNVRTTSASDTPAKSLSSSSNPS